MKKAIIGLVLAAVMATAGALVAKAQYGSYGGIAGGYNPISQWIVLSGLLGY